MNFEFELEFMLLLPPEYVVFRKGEEVFPIED